MKELRRQAFASDMDSAPLAFGARVLGPVPAMPSDYPRFSDRISRSPRKNPSHCLLKYCRSDKGTAKEG